jgi:hypothetical protein
MEDPCFGEVAEVVVILIYSLAQNRRSYVGSRISLRAVLYFNDLG